jgi:serine/threonine protein kinase
VQFLSFGTAQGTFFFAMEYCAGGTVERWMAERGGKLPLDEAGQIVLQTLDGLEYAHNAEFPDVQRADGSIGQGCGIIHRNLGPKNLFLTSQTEPRVVKIGDYSLSKAFDMAGLGGCTRTGMTFAKPLFVPRQQVIDFRYTNPDADVWAAAATLYNMLTGHTPRDFPRGKDPWQVVLNTPPVLLRVRDRTLPERLAEVLDYALDDSQELHFKSAAEFKKALTESL